MFDLISRAVHVNVIVFKKSDKSHGRMFDKINYWCIPTK